MHRIQPVDSIVFSFVQNRQTAFRLDERGQVLIWSMV